MLTYTIGEGKEKDWIIGEKEFALQHQGKGESIFCLANGYMGIRSAYEEPYPFQSRGMFVSGCFNSSQNETVELPNAADSCQVVLKLDDEFFSMNVGEISGYSRFLNLYTGELIRSLHWKSPKGRRYDLIFHRTVSHSDPHAYGLQIGILPIDGDVRVEVASGINARMTNSGAQHFKDGTKKVIQQKLLYLDQTTTQSGITLYHCCGTTVRGAQEEARSFSMQRRMLMEQVSFQIRKGEKASFEKLAVLYTSKELAEQDEGQILGLVVCHLESLIEEGYAGLIKKSAAFMRDYWQQHDVLIKTNREKVQLALRFAQYHLLAMLPLDSHSSIAAKGLTGEGYKGHVFWDTEVFILPYYLLNEPNKAKQLLEYRLNRMEQAGENARKKGFQGIMFPWESAQTGEEETPLFTSMDIFTGRAAQVWAGIKEHHITADVAYAVSMYALATGDCNFLEDGGNLLIIGAALFWASRSVYQESRKRYEIKDIIGPDEYTEHVDNNAYSNYMAYDAVQKAIRILQENPGNIQEKAQEYYHEPQLLARLMEFADGLYLPQPLEEPKGVIPQDDTFMSKRIIDISKYRMDNVKQTILKEYSREQVNEMQVLKQADVLMLLEIFPDLFPVDVKIANWNYYEPKTIHDSSLSRAIYSVVASDCGEPEKAYDSFIHAIDIDMGQNPCSSDEGIHAAAMGGIWLSVVRGFAGVRVLEKGLGVNPCLPDEIREIQFSLTYRKKKMQVCVTAAKVSLVSDDKVEIDVMIGDKRYCFVDRLEADICR